MGVLNNLNYIKTLMYFPCDQPGPSVLIETGINALAPTLLELASWSCRDIIKLRAGISYRCGRQLKAIIKAAHGAAVIDKVHFLYSFGAPIERLNWYFFLAELSTSFVANWTSLVYKAQHCIPEGDSCQGNGRYLVTMVLTPNQPIGLIYFFDPPSGHCSHGSATQFIVPAGWYWQAWFSAKGSSLLSGIPCDLDLWIESLTGSGFSFPVENFTPPFLGGDTVGTYKMKSQAPLGFANYHYAMMVKSNTLTVTTGGRCMIMISKEPILDSPVLGVGCFGSPPPAELGL